MSFNLRSVTSHSIGGGWGFDQYKEGCEEVFVIRGTDIPKLKLGDFSTVPCRYERSSKVEARLLKEGDIVLESAGGSAASNQHTGRPLLVTKDILNGLGGKAIPASFCKLLRLNMELVSPSYIVKLIESMHLDSTIAKYEKQSTGIANFQLNYFLDDLIIKEVSTCTQSDIALFIDKIDLKISNNHAMSATLEKIAQRIFKSWFVDFDPVKANAEGVACGKLSPEIQALFPKEFVESELGLIPKGWEVSSIEKEVKTVGGATPSTKNPDFWDDGDVLWTTPKDLSDLKDKIIFNTSRKITPLGLEKISSGLLSKNTILMSSRAPVGYLAIAKEPMAINQGYIAMKCDQDITPYYMLCWLEKNMDIIKQRSGGTTFSEISKANFRPIEFLKPSVDAIKQFEQVVTPLFDRIETNARMTNDLSKIRDKLLPRLISGKITIQKAKEIIDEAA